MGTQSELELVAATPSTPTDAGELSLSPEASAEIGGLEREILRHKRAYYDLAAPEIRDAEYDALEERLRVLCPSSPVLDMVGSPSAGGEVEHDPPMLSLGKVHQEADFRRWARVIGVRGGWEPGRIVDLDGCQGCSPTPCRAIKAVESVVRQGVKARGTYTEETIVRVHERACGLTKKERDELAKGTATEFHASWREIELVASPKIDGVACALRYDSRGVLSLAATRGSGARGDDVTHNVLQMADVPARLPTAFVSRISTSCEVRGEVYMPLHRFARLSDRFANPRNLTAGLLTSKEPGQVPLSELHFFAYDLLGPELERERDKAPLLKSMGFVPAPTETVDVDGAVTLFGEWETRRDGDDFESDGVVFKLDDIGLQRRLGQTAHHPRWAIACKYAAELGRSRLREVEWSVSRTGTITPVAIVEPVTLAGATVTRATLHNVSTLQALGMRIGDTLTMARRGGVIPHVEGVVAEGRVLPPAACPSCGRPTITRTRERRLPTGAHALTLVLVCSEPGECPAAQRGAILHYTRTLEIDGFGEELVAALQGLGALRDAADLYELTAERLEQVPRLGRKTSEKLVAQLEASRQVSQARFLTALGVEGLGRRTAELLSHKWDLDGLLKLGRDDLQKEHTFQQVTANQIIDGLQAAGPLIQRLREHLEIGAAWERGPGGGPLAGHTIVFTGALQRMTRRDAQKRITRLGATAGSGLARSTTILVVGGDGLAAANPSSKIKKARRLAAEGAPISILSESELEELIRAADE